MNSFILYTQSTVVRSRLDQLGEHYILFCSLTDSQIVFTIYYMRRKSHGKACHLEFGNELVSDGAHSFEKSKVDDEMSTSVLRW